MREIRKSVETIDIWFDNHYIECPICGEYLTNQLTKSIVEVECKCGKKFEIHTRFFISEVK